MFKSTFELQQFLEWAKDQKIKRIKVDSIEVEFSELGFLPETELKDIQNSGAATLAESEPSGSKEDEELLYWSSNS